MRTPAWTSLFLALGLALAVPTLAQEQKGASPWARFQAQSAQAVAQAHEEPTLDEALPAGVEELRFQDIFEPVIGDKGPTFTARMLALDGKRVRVTGFMVRETTRNPGVFMLAPWPTRIESDGYCVTEDYPPATLHVLLPETATRLTVPYSPRAFSVVGVLHTRPGVMPDGRNAVAWLQTESAGEISLPLVSNLP